MSQIAGRAVSSHVMCCRTRRRQLTPVAYPGVSMNGLYDSIVKIVISHHVQFSYLGRTFISSRDQAFFPPFFAVMGPRYGTMDVANVATIDLSRVPEIILTLSSSSLHSTVEKYNILATLPRENGYSRIGND